jgi:hypothetical protein
MTKLTVAIFIVFLGSMIATDGALALCKPGNKNCITAGPNIPKFCGSPGKPCQIDSGLGSQCKGGGTCGIAEQTVHTQGIHSAAGQTLHTQVIQ